LTRAATIGDKNSARSPTGVVRIAIHACALILSATASVPGVSQSTQQPRLDPNQIEKNFETFQAEQQRGKKPAVKVPTLARPETPRADTKPLFRLTTVSVRGESVISGDMIAETYRSYIGKTVSQADLVAIAGQISDLYRKAGYHLSRAIVPPQDIKNGRIEILVIEGKIAEIVLKREGTEQFGVRALLQPVEAEQVSRLETLERQLLLVNDLPGVRISDTALEEIGVATGRFRLIVDVKTWHFSTALGLDNLGTSAVGPLQAYSTSALNSYFVEGDKLGLNLATNPVTPPEIRFGRLSYDAPLGIDGLRLGAAASYSEVWPSDERKQTNTRIQTETYELRGTIVPLLSRTSSLRLSATAGFSDVSERTSLGTNYSDHIRTVGLIADYKLQDGLGGSNYLTVALRQGIDVLGASHKGDALLSSEDASANFSLLNFAFARYQKLSDVWSLKISAAGQLASRALLTSQEFYIGGMAFGRGYDVGEVSGDNGIAGSVELRFDQVLINNFPKGYQLYGFIDRGLVWNFGDGINNNLTLTSVGGGLRLYLTDDLQADVAISLPVDYRSPANIARNPRILFSLSKFFSHCPAMVHMRCL
jgi:hemolysin activation/secretion protein